MQRASCWSAVRRCRRSSPAWSDLPLIRFQSIHQPPLAERVPRDEHKTRQRLDYSRLIDPLSLRNTLDAVRDANRSSLIRKVTQDGQFYPLQIPGYLTSTEHASSRKVDKSRPSRETKKESMNSSTQTTNRRTRIKTPKVGDYAGEVFPLQTQWQASESLASRWRLPWLSHLDAPQVLSSTNAHERLAAEINAFARFLTPTESEQEAIDGACHDIKAAFATTQHALTFSIMGSRATGLASPLADIDINVTSAEGHTPDELEHRPEALDLLRSLRSSLAKAKRRGDNAVVRTVQIHSIRFRARIPIITGVHIPTGLDYQVQFTTSGYNTTEYAKDFIREYPNLKNLFCTLKQMLVMRGLTDGPSGGLTSYPLLMMIVACLKLHAGSMTKTDVAGHLLAFLDMYSEINFYNTGLSVYPPEYISVSNSRLKSSNRAIRNGADEALEVQSPGSSDPVDEDQKPSPSSKATEHFMFLIDPADPSNDLGKSVAMIKHVQATIIELRERLHREIKMWDAAAVGSEEQGVFDKSILACLIAGDYKSFQVDRARLAQAHLRNQSQESEEAP